MKINKKFLPNFLEFLFLVAFLMLFDYLYSYEPEEILLAEPLLSIKKLSLKCNTPEKLSDYLERSIKYMPDEDIWGYDCEQSAQMTLALGQGDCEDFAILVHEVLDGLKIPNKMYYGYGKKYGHVICVFFDGKYWQVFSCQYIKKVNADSDIGAGVKYFPKKTRFEEYKSE